MQPKPLLCHPKAYRYFAQQLPVIHSTAGLLNAATAIAMHGLQSVEPAAVRRRLQDLSQRVKRRVRSRQPMALLAHLHDVLFEDVGFRGNSEDYYNPLNSYIPAVLDTRRGIPITLCLIYRVVAEGVGFEVEGVNTPGHFLVRLRTPEGWMLVDPFCCGGVLTEEEAFDRVDRVTGRPTPRTAQYLAAASHPQWLSRMLMNLQHVFASTDRRGDLVAMGELQSLPDDMVC